MQIQKLVHRKQKALREGNQDLLDLTCIDLAELYSNEGRYEDAIAEYQEVAAIRKQKKNNLGYATVIRAIGENYHHLKKFSKALEYHLIYLDIAQQENNNLEAQRAHACIGHTHLSSFLENADDPNPDRKHLKLAFKAFMKSLMICESLTDINKQEKKDMMARLFSNLGLVEESLGNYDKGLELVGKSIDICKKYDLYEQLERSYMSLASLYLHKGQHQMAINQYNLAYDTAGRLKNKVPLMCGALSAKADILIKLSAFREAKNVLLKAYKLRHPDTNEAESIERNLKIVASMCKTEDSLLMANSADYKTRKVLYEKLGDGASILKNFEAAAQYYEKMLKAAVELGESGPELSPCYSSIAECYADDRQFEKAVEFHWKDYKACRTNTKERIASLLNIADCMEGAEKDFDEIENIYIKARKECAVCGEKRLEAKVLSRYKKLLENQGRFALAKALEVELNELGIDEVDVENELTDEQATPDIGDEIDLKDITDESDSSDAEDSKTRAVRKRRKTFIIKKNNKGETPLHLACIKGDFELVRRLLDQGHAVNVRDNCGWLPIHEACNNGFLEITKVLIEQGANINDRGGKDCGGITPLHDAALNGHLEIVQLLLDKGASALVKSDAGELPLHVLQTWHARTQTDSNNQSDAVDYFLYNQLIDRLTQAAEKAGHRIDLVEENPRTVLVADVQKDHKEPKKASRTQAKAVGSLRRTFNLPDYDSNSNDTHYSTDSSESDDTTKRCLIETPVTEDYRRVMETMKHPFKEHIVEKKRKSVESPCKSAFLAPEEVGDDWLQDDLGNLQKKRRTMSNPFGETLGLRRNSASLSLRQSSSTHLKSKASGSSNKELDIPSDFLNAEFDVNDEEVLSDDDSRTTPNSSKSRHSLIEHGFTRRKSFSPSKRNTQISSNLIQTQKQKHQTKITNFGSVDLTSNTVRHSESAISAPTFASNPIWSVDVRIDGKLYRVPIPSAEVHNKTIKWLMDEATKRYSRKECMKPTLELQLKNGAILADEDYVGILFPTGTSQAEEVEGRIVKWNIPPLSDRYTEACVNENLEPSEKLQKILKEVSTVLDIANLSLKSKPLDPLCKVINRHTGLHHLDLSGNTVECDTMELLCTSLQFLVNLAILNLSSTQLTSDHISIFADMFTQSQRTILENLVSLNLSYNALGNESFKFLAIVTRFLKLSTLTLMNVDFTSEIFNFVSNKNIDLFLDHVVDFDVSYNQLRKQQIAIFLSWLKVEKVENLNVSSNIPEDGIVKEVIDWLQSSSSNLQHLNLSRCSVSDAEVFVLLRTLEMNNNFNTLNLSYNENLTSLTLRRLLQHRPSFMSLDLTGCNSILKYYEDCSESVQGWTLRHFKISAESFRSDIKKFFIDSWQETYKEKAKVKELRNFLELCSE